MVSTTKIFGTAATSQPATNDAATGFQQLTTRTTAGLEQRLPGISGASGYHRAATITMVWFRHCRAGAGTANGPTAAIWVSLLLPGTAATLGRRAAKFAGKTADIRATSSRQSAGKSLVRLAGTWRCSVSRLGCTLWRISGNRGTRLSLVKTRDTRHVRGSCVVSSSSSLCCWSEFRRGIRL